LKTTIGPRFFIGHESLKLQENRNIQRGSYPSLLILKWRGILPHLELRSTVDRARPPDLSIK
jgi:hypothetical protein